MYILDSDHLSILQRQQGIEYDNLFVRCSRLKAVDFFVTIISFHEQFNGWTKFVARAKDSGALVKGYTELEIVVDTFSRAQVLPFSAAAADVYDELRQQKVRIGSMDLRIASITVGNQMTLLTRNTVDFERVPNLSFADWTLPLPT
jgi:tRNA(fMet)-specific endonuclease VapC